jgi:hypothetical protein
MDAWDKLEKMQKENEIKEEEEREERQKKRWKTFTPEQKKQLTKIFGKKKGWRSESARHAMAAKGMKTGRKSDKVLLDGLSKSMWKIPYAKTSPTKKKFLKKILKTSKKIFY